MYRAVIAVSLLSRIARRLPTDFGHSHHHQSPALEYLRSENCSSNIKIRQVQEKLLNGHSEKKILQFTFIRNKLLHYSLYSVYSFRSKKSFIQAESKANEANLKSTSNEFVTKLKEIKSLNEKST